MADLTSWPTVSTSATEARWSQMVSRWFSSGVLVGASNEFAPSADSSGMQVRIDAGEAMLRGFFAEHSSALTLAIAAASASFDRRDLVVLRLDTSANASVELIVRTGTAQASPVAPTPSDTSTVLDVPIAEVFVPKSATTIRSQDVSDRRQFVNLLNGEPVGSVKMMLADRIPAGYLPLEGGTYTRADYPVLSSLLGGSGSTFTLPDMSNRVPMGGGSLGSAGGANSRTIAKTNLPAESLSVSGSTSGGSHSHGFSGAAHSHSVTDPGHGHGMDGDTGNRFVVTASPSTYRVPYKVDTSGGQEVSFSDIDPATTGVINSATVAGGTVAASTVSAAVAATTEAMGSGSALDTTPAHLRLRFFVRAA